MIHILHAYSDLMNIYGDYANLLVLQQRLEGAGHKVKIHTSSVRKETGLEQYDFIYIGAGTEDALLRAAAEAGDCGPSFGSYLDFGGRLLATGNAMALLGNEIVALDGSRHPGMGVLNLSATITPGRRYGEFVMRTSRVEKPVIGAINTSLSIESAADPLFQVLYATGVGIVGVAEGAAAPNLLASQLSGPLLVRNPALLDYVAEWLGGTLPFCTDAWYLHAHAGYENACKTLAAEAAKKGIAWQSPA